MKHNDVACIYTISEWVWWRTTALAKMCVLVSWATLTTYLRFGGFKHQISTLSQFWGQRVKNQGASSHAPRCPGMRGFPAPGKFIVNSGEWIIITKCKRGLMPRFILTAVGGTLDSRPPSCLWAPLQARLPRHRPHSWFLLRSLLFLGPCPAFPSLLLTQGSKALLSTPSTGWTSVGGPLWWLADSATNYVWELVCFPPTPPSGW